ncbi:putative acid--CoA ligase [Gordonia hirsuta DSM 44140 = NBRC 16056]|uniref:Putative acid--CoA ligase n=1 Tax=Gordonia hirsuta DSM 44140 = NBRC 16056 TaxID=1121927 RepID=L7L593_9ACTN|nr:AMP-binding protein [Gordonia hirsuta]GAC56310.1 putative acid--CoA ligase [Gordonia hirsuta DSM 44140 = NBRC 16056]
MKIEHSAVIAADAEHVWDLCADPLVLARYAGRGLRVTAHDPGRGVELDARYRIMVTMGAAVVGGDAIIVACQRPWELAWASYSGVSHRVRLRLRPVPGGTRLTVRLSYDAPGVFGGLADLVSAPAIHSFVKDAVAGLKRQAEGAVVAEPSWLAVPRRLAEEAGSLEVLARAGIVSAMRPDRLLRVAGAARSWGLTPGALLAIGAVREPDRPLVIAPDRTLTYVEADRRSTAIAAGMRALGIGEGDAVALLSRNHPEFVLAAAAIAKLGCDLLLLNTGFAGPQIADVCRREGASAIVHDAEFTTLLAEASVNRKRILTDASPSVQIPTLTELADGFTRATLRSPGRSGKVIILTSGTTGTPKGASRGAVSGGGLPTLEAPAALLSRIPLRAGIRIGLAAPAFHAWGLSNLLLGLGLTAQLITLPVFDAQDWLAAVEEHRIEALIVVPVMLSRILDLPAEVRERYDTSSLKVVAASGSALPGGLSDEWMDAFGENLYNLYGSTEVANATIATPADLRTAPGTAGRPTRGTTIKLFDDDGLEVPQGGLGRIFVGNAQLFEGYTEGGDKQRIGGLMASGDIGRFDAAGRLFVEGRDDDMIVSGGENVFPQEVEDLLSARPEVSEAVCIGVPDEDFGQRLRAYVVLRDGAHTGEKELIAEVKKNLAGYKAPREVVFVDRLPRNATGKVLRRELAQLSAGRSPAG